MKQEKLIISLEGVVSGNMKEEYLISAGGIFYAVTNALAPLDVLRPKDGLFKGSKVKIQIGDTTIENSV